MGTSPADARIRVFFQSREAREAVRAHLTPLLREMEDKATKAELQLEGWKAGTVQLDDDARELALQATLLKCDEPTISEVALYDSKGTYGLGLPERLLWQAYVVQQDISHPPGWETGRPSEPAFMDLNLHATRDGGLPLAVLWQYDVDNPLNPRGLLIAHEEAVGVRPVASDMDAFLVGSKGMGPTEPIPPDQVELVKWSLKQLDGVLAEPKSQGWTKRWLEVLKRETSKGMSVNMPPYGFGDPRSYDIIAKAVHRLNTSGAVRHGAECFNFWFPQELDEEFFIVWDGFPRYFGNNHVPWAYVGQQGLRDFLLARVEEGYTFPLNPKWILCDSGFGDVYAALDAKSRSSMDSWLPPGTGLREQLEAIRAAHPAGFVPEIKAGETVEVIDQDLAEWELSRHQVLHRAKIKLRAVYRLNKSIGRLSSSTPAD